ncbi:IS4 family transposase [Chromobacterium haemolyticum]
MGRKSDGEPGVKSLWLGLQQIASCVAGMRFQQSCG